MPVVSGHLLSGDLSQKPQGTHATSRSRTPQEGRTETAQSCRVTVCPRPTALFLSAPHMGCRDGKTVPTGVLG